MSEKIRVFKHAAEDAIEVDLVSYTRSIAGIIENNFLDVERYLHEHGNEVIKVDAPEELSRLGSSFIEIRPPLEERQLRKFANFCLSLGDSKGRSIDVINNRDTIPERSTENAGEIIAWL